MNKQIDYKNIKFPLIFGDNYFTYIEFDERLKGKIERTNTIWGITYFILLFFFMPMIYFKYIGNSNLIVLFLITLLLVISTFIYSRKKLDEWEHGLRMNQNNYPQIHSFQVREGELPIQVINPDDPVWRTGVLMVFWDENPTIIEKYTNHLKKNLTFKGYENQELRYATAEDSVKVVYEYILPVIITMNNKIYPLIDVEYFEKIHMKQLAVSGRAWAVNITHRINEKYKLNQKLSKEGYKKDCDLICDLGYFISIKSYNTYPYIIFNRIDFDRPMSFPARKTE